MTASPVTLHDMSQSFGVSAQFIEIERLEVQTRLGVSKIERSKPQNVQISLTISVVTKLPNCDQIGEVVDYSVLISRVRTLCAGTEYKLVETLATKIASLVFEDQRVLTVRVGIHKPDIYDDVERVGADITFRREAFFPGSPPAS